MNRTNSTLGSRLSGAPAPDEANASDQKPNQHFFFFFQDPGCFQRAAKPGTPEGGVLIAPFYQREKRRSERSSHVPTVTQLRSHGASIPVPTSEAPPGSPLTPSFLQEGSPTLYGSPPPPPAPQAEHLGLLHVGRAGGSGLSTREPPGGSAPSSSDSSTSILPGEKLWPERPARC